MNARELRIGNWVYNNNGYVMEVISIDQTDVLLNIKQFEGDPFEYVISEIKPIPLTEEWLENFGFTTKNKVDFESNCGVIDLESTDAGYLFDSRIVIKYVHQLQNLYFALTGEELTIK